MVKPRLAEQSERAAIWLANSAALWGGAGVHPVGGFREELSMDGAPLETETSRVRVQARQTFCFALLADLSGTVSGLDRESLFVLTEKGVATLLDACRRPDGLYGRRMQNGGSLSDPTADLYDNAFALLALSKAAEIGSDRAGDAATNLSQRIDTLMRRPETEGGYFEMLPQSEVRLQNPHMHLLEASLLHTQVTGDRASADRACRLETLMADRFLSNEGGLREVFRENWTPLEGDRHETGHQYEWVWLLHEKAKVLGGSVHPAADTLYGMATRLTGQDGAIYLEHHLSGSLKDSTRRCWGVTEAIKAHLARLEAGDGGAEDRAVAAIDQLFELFLDPAPAPGGWVDRYDGFANPLSLSMPASTGYHVYLALAELIRVAHSD